jgi:membrane complex biogenesis BtpA family protein
MSNEIIKSIFKINKPIIGMVHFKALPGSPLFNDKEGIENMLILINKDIEALQDGGIDAIMFGNENDRPYQTKVSEVTIATMSYLIGRVRQKIKVPFGVDVLYDPRATIAVAKATGASFIREVFTSVFAGDIGLWNTSCGEVLRYRDAIKGNNIITMYNINAEFASTLETRPIELIAKSVVFSSLPDILLISGSMTGDIAAASYIEKVKKAVPDILVFINTGLNLNNISEMLQIADGAIVGTSFKKDGITWNPIEKIRVIELMEKVKEIRKL